MDPKNSGFIVEDELNESDFTTVSSIGGMDMKQIIEKIQKLEDMAMKNAKGLSNGDQSGMMFWQMGEKFGKMELKIDGMSKENAELKDGITKLIKELDGLKAKNAEKDREIEGIKKENEGMKKENADIIAKMMKDFQELKAELMVKEREMEEMKKAIEGLKTAKTEENPEFEELKEENGRKLKEIDEFFTYFCRKYAEMEGKIAGLKEEEEKLKEKIRELQGKIGEMDKFTEQNDGIEWVIKYDWNAYKLSEVDCGPILKISEGGLVVKHSEPNYIWNSVQANWPIPTYNNFGITKPTFAFYFETEILKPNGGIVIGFCGQEFPLEGKWLGNEKNSIGICNKGGIWIDGSSNNFGNVYEIFKNGDVIGLGIIYKPNSKMECFVTTNGKLLGKIEIPSKFTNIQLFPTINLYYTNETIRTNFDKNKFQFKEFGRILQ